MNFLIIGLGSMGKRRVRNLHALGYNNIIGFDMRDDRRDEAEEKYHIKTTGSLTEEIINKADAIVISVPPDKHNKYIELCIDYSKPCFVEASVILGSLPVLNREAKSKRVLVVPSCTMRFHPAIKTIKNLVKNKQYGGLTNFTYHSGQYLPDWHPWERIKDYYVGQKQTGGCREIVPFELSWLLDVVGMPEEVFAYHAKTLDFDVNIDDVYTIVLRFRDFLGALIVDVTARVATRVLIINLERAQIRWDWAEKIVRVYEADNGRWVYYHEPEGSSAAGYDKNIIEEMYIDEMKTFINTVTGKGKFPNTLDDDIKILKILEAMEKTNKGVMLK